MTRPSGLLTSLRGLRLFSLRATAAAGCLATTATGAGEAGAEVNFELLLLSGMAQATPQALLPLDGDAGGVS